MRDAWRFAAFVVAATLAGSCTTAGQRNAAERAAVKQEVAAEVERICALPEPEREAELKRVKEESGLTLFCAE
jgi:hypothetical protein